MANVYTVLRPGRGPSDDEIERLLRIHQGGIAVFFHALRTFGAPKVIIEACALGGGASAALLPGA